jgi:hypothetical protein
MTYKEFLYPYQSKPVDGGNVYQSYRLLQNLNRSRISDVLEYRKNIAHGFAGHRPCCIGHISSAPFIPTTQVSKNPLFHRKIDVIIQILQH